MCLSAVAMITTHIRVDVFSMQSILFSLVLIITCKMFESVTSYNNGRRLLHTNIFIALDVPREEIVKWFPFSLK